VGLIVKTHLIDFPDMGVTVKIVWDSNQELYEVICGTTYIGTAATVAEGKTVARHWFNELMAV
jgi:hypothetical protein